jgi:seryl-tRNA synthetase
MIGGMARLVRSLLQLFLDEAGRAGYCEVMTPLLVNEESARATGHLPDKEGQMYELANERFFLIPTAEVPITNYFREEILEFCDLPVAWCGYTPCFRREAGSYGKEVRGLNRIHQFDKVELVRWVHPEDSYEELEQMLKHVEGLLQKLELPFRVLLMCTGEIGFPHAKQYDFEVWAGGQKRWLEVSSCSNFTDFQARRSNIRYRDQSGRLGHVHTLNGSALAIPRVLAALLENNLQEGNCVHLPQAVAEIFGDEVLTL